MKKRLNGWQRLWIVFCGLCFLATGVITVLTLPTGSEHERKRLLDSIDLVSRHNAILQRVEAAGFSKAEIKEYLSKGGKLDNVRLVDHESPDTIRTKYYADLSDKEILARLHETYSKKVDFGSIEAEYKKDMARSGTDRLRFGLYAFLVWCCISLGVYGLGFSVAWVIKGFRQKQQS